MNTPATDSADLVRITPLTRADRSDFLSLLQLATPTEPVPVAVEQTTYLSAGPYPFTHGPGMCLTARTPNSPTIVGALLASVFDWAFLHPLCTASPLLSELLTTTVLRINAVAVHPDHRGHHIASTLIDSAERRARRAGFRLTILEHERHLNLSAFYTKLGYTVADHRLIAVVPGADLLAQEHPRRYKTAVKPLLPSVRVVHVPGAPAPIISGLFPGCDVPPTARFHNGHLTA
ncbi:GNAT family N-acetyltransferase [Streptomyces sp. NPDC048192]|uniref:GNAT family N-acetyltransferase n=1 Tax=Streptomyces sp. NPDC048192 TaxID=3365510 RepID=UPI003710FAF7